MLLHHFLNLLRKNVTGLVAVNFYLTIDPYIAQSLLEVNILFPWSHEVEMVHYS